MSRCFRSFVQPLSTPVSKFISNHPSHYHLENNYSNMKALQMLLAQVITRGFSGSLNPEIAVELPGWLTYPSVFKDGAQLHGRVVKTGSEFDRFIRNMMINMYANCGVLSEARKLFDENEVVDVVAWNTIMITGYAKCGKIADSRKLFDIMQLLEQGKWIHTYMKMLNVIVITALINMCACGGIKTAYRVFEDTTLGYNDLSCRNTMIMGLAINGFQNETIQLIFRLLLPDSVLTACNNSGLGNEVMKTVYNIKPLSQQYCCIMHLEEAEHLTKQMPLNPDAAICGSLLSAARYHNNVKMARREAEKLAQLEPHESGSYAASGHFFKAIEERVALKETTRIQFN